jgi:Fe-S cluster biogenesis protein NfuA
MTFGNLRRTLSVALLLSVGLKPSRSFSPSLVLTKRRSARGNDALQTASSSESTKGEITAPPLPAPVLDGKRVLPYKIIMAGLRSSSKIPAVYAVLNSGFQRGSEGWDKCVVVGVAQDLESTLRTLHEQDATELQVAHVRALSFSFPNPNAMQDFASQWRTKAVDAGAKLDDKWANDVLDYLFDDDDEDDDEIDDDMDMAAEAMAVVSSSENEIISPFAETSNGVSDQADSHSDAGPLEFTAANVDKVLDEVRPYLIADGGNVSIERVDEEGKIVYLKLEGACGSCASSTVTMQMGIERVLKENFPDINGILQSEEDAESKPKELTLESVEVEVNRLRPALTAMGAVVELVGIDAATGLVDIRFRGANKVQQGLELAILDVPFVNKVNFIMGDDE